MAGGRSRSVGEVADRGVLNRRCSAVRSNMLRKTGIREKGTLCAFVNDYAGTYYLIDSTKTDRSVRNFCPALLPNLSNNLDIRQNTAESFREKKIAFPLLCEANGILEAIELCK